MNPSADSPPPLGLGGGLLFLESRRVWPPQGPIPKIIWARGFFKTPTESAFDRPPWGKKKNHLGPQKPKKQPRKAANQKSWKKKKNAPPPFLVKKNNQAPNPLGSPPKSVFSPSQGPEKKTKQKKKITAEQKKISPPPPPPKKITGPPHKLKSPGGAPPTRPQFKAPPPRPPRPPGETQKGRNGQMPFFFFFSPRWGGKKRPR